MKDALRRAARTFVQAFLGIFLACFSVPPVAQLVTGQPLNVLPTPDYFANVVLGATFAGCIAVLSLVQNWAENTTGKTTPGLPK